MVLHAERERLVEYGKRISQEKLSTGTSGNLSIYNAEEGLMAITPSGMSYFEITPEDIVVMDLENHIVDSKRALIDSSAQNIMLADSSKFDLVKANHFAELHDMDMLITDNKLSLDWRDFLNNAQINLKLV